MMGCSINGYKRKVKKKVGNKGVRESIEKKILFEHEKDKNFEMKGILWKVQQG
jgi:hypothetical protein